MEIRFSWGNQQFSADLNQSFDLSLPYGSDESYSAWGSPSMKAEPVRYGEWVGSVEAGSSVNFFDLTLNPHGNGTHTEWAGHILKDRGSVNQQLSIFWFPALLVEVTPDSNGAISEPNKLESESSLPPAIILRTSPSYERPASRDYTSTAPPFLTEEFAQALRLKGVEHLLIDLPSVDPEEDGGALVAHRAFWNVPEELRTQATITELINVPFELEEGIYFLNLQVAPLENDASPSRPIIFPAKLIS
jgi:arylformamidase